jgi:hypothetical protein
MSEEEKVVHSLGLLLGGMVKELMEIPMCDDDAAYGTTTLMTGPGGMCQVEIFVVRGSALIKSFHGAAHNLYDVHAVKPDRRYN